MIVHEEMYTIENEFYLQQWKNSSKGELEFYSFDYDHLDLIETSAANDWLTILSQELDDCS